VPQVSGDLYEEKTRFGPYVACLQCGRSLDARQQKVLGVNPVTSPLPVGSMLSRKIEVL